MSPPGASKAMGKRIRLAMKTGLFRGVHEVGDSYTSGRPLVVIGAGGFGRQIPWILEDINTEKPGTWSFEGFADDSMTGVTVEGYPIVGNIERLFDWSPKPIVVCAFGDPRVRRRVVAQCIEHGMEIATIKHPSVIHPTHVVIGGGSILSAGTIMSTGVFIGAHSLINFGCGIGHDVQLGSFTSVMPNVSIGGETTVGDGVFVGIGASIKNQVAIGEWSVIGAGTVVVRDVPPRSVVVGVPGRVIGEITPEASQTRI